MKCRQMTTNHRLGRNELDNACITRLDEFGGILDRLSCSSVNLFNELSEFACNVGSVAIEDRCVTSTNLTGVVEDDDLGIEGSSLLGGVVLRV